MNNKYIYLIISLTLLFANCKDIRKDRNKPTDKDTTKLYLAEPRYQYGVRIDTLDIDEYRVQKNDNLSAIFNRMGFSMGKIDTIIRSSKEVLNPRRIMSGNEYLVLSSRDTTATIKYVIFEKNDIDFSIIDFTQDSIIAYEYNKDITIRTHYTEGEINDNLWNTIVNNGGDPLLSLKLSDMYAWQIDFFDVKKGDSFKVVYDVAYIDDSIPLHIGDVRSAIFTHQKTKFIAIPFEQDSILEFFDEKGNSLRKAFLKAPLNFNRVSSRFSNARYHPVLKRYRAHHGVDYAAPTGTPVKTIGDGVVVAKAYQKNGGGYYLKVKHNSVYTTTYMHLSRFAKSVMIGKRVQQGDVIAYVGSTGLSTGPHLDFRVHKNGKPLDPLKMESPPSLPVKPELMDSFNVVMKTLLDDMSDRSVAFKKNRK